MWWGWLISSRPLFYGLSSKSCSSMVWPGCQCPIRKLGSYVTLESQPPLHASVHLYLINGPSSSFPSSFTSNHKDNILLILVSPLPDAWNSKLSPTPMAGTLPPCWLIFLLLNMGLSPAPSKGSPLLCFIPLWIPQETSCELPVVY